MAQLKSTNITGNLSVTGGAIASEFKKPGGTSAEFLKADGTVDATEYATKEELGDVATALSNIQSQTEAILGGN